MSVQEIQAAIIELPLTQLAQLSTGLEEHPARVWDRQVEGIWRAKQRSR